MEKEAHLNTNCITCKNKLDISLKKTFYLLPCDHLLCNECFSKNYVNLQEKKDSVYVDCTICKQPKDLNVQHQNKLKSFYDDILKKQAQEIEELKKLNEDLQENQYFRCKTHSKQFVKFFCSCCKSFLCLQCQPQHFAHHDSIEDYDTQKIQKYAKFSLKEFESLKSKVEDRIKDLKEIAETQKLQDIETVKQKLQKAEDLLFTDFKKVYQKNFLGYTLFNRVQVFDSQIETNPKTQLKLVELLPKHKLIELLYRGTRDSFKALYFHQQCDGKGQTFTIVKANEMVFGGFTDISWSSPEKEEFKKGDQKSFLFQIKDKKIVKFQCKDMNKEVCHQKLYLPTFGDGKDLFLSDDCNKNKQNYSNIGGSYECPAGLSYKQEATRKFFAGAIKFDVQEIEVFMIK